MARFAKGTYSKAVCDRCGRIVDYKDLKKEWNNLYTCGDCWDPKHPQLMPARMRADAQILRHPRPDFDAHATSYPTIADPSYPGYSTWGPTTQLFEVVSMTFGETT